MIYKHYFNDAKERKVQWGSIGKMRKKEKQNETVTISSRYVVDLALFNTSENDEAEFFDI